MYRHTVVVVLAMLAMAAVINGQTSNYCTICSNRQHTMCKYQDLSVGSTCKANKKMVKIAGGVDSGNQTSIVDLHNLERAKVAGGNETRGKPGPQPSASNMRVLAWDTELATLAQRWADQCTQLRDTCRKVDRFTVGQNVMKTTSTSTTPSWSDVIDAWSDEAKFLSNAKVTNYVWIHDIAWCCVTVRDGGFGPIRRYLRAAACSNAEFGQVSTFNERNEQKSHHYSRMVWGPTTKVGCGFSAFSQSSSSSNAFFYVCNYGIGGIPLGSTVSLYQTGTNCSSCSSGASCDTTYTSLCTS